MRDTPYRIIWGPTGEIWVPLGEVSLKFKTASEAFKYISKTNHLEEYERTLFCCKNN